MAWQAHYYRFVLIRKMTNPRDGKIIVSRFTIDIKFDFHHITPKAIKYGMIKDATRWLHDCYRGFLCDHFTEIKQREFEQRQRENNEC